MAIQIRSANNYGRDQLSGQTGLRKGSPSKTQQNQKHEADINTIIKKFGLISQMPTAIYKEPIYGDFTAITDFKAALNQVKKAEEFFMMMPAEVRNRFRNDPQELLEFLRDDRNRAEAEKLGLIEKSAPDTGPAAPTPAPEPVQ